MRLASRLDADLRAAVRGLEARPRPELTRVELFGRSVSDPDRYAALFDRFRGADPPATDATRIDVAVVTDDVAELIEAEGRRAAASERSSWPSYASLAGLLVGGVGLGWLMLGRRRSRAHAT
jgi:hypothetical protein